MGWTRILLGRALGHSLNQMEKLSIKASEITDPMPKESDKVLIIKKTFNLDWVGSDTDYE